MLQQFDRIGSVVHKSIAQELRRRSEATRLDVIKSLGGHKQGFTRDFFSGLTVEPLYCGHLWDLVKCLV